MKRDVYPLAWPDHWPRTKDRAKSAFKSTLASALGNVSDSVRLFAKDSDREVENLLISSNVSLGNQNPADPGVAVYFTWDGLDTCIAVDRYLKVQENLQAIHHCIEAERTKLRHGGLNLVRAAFTGYAKLPPPSDVKNARSWWLVLGCKEDTPHDEVKTKYRKARSKYHPDKGSGDPGKYSEVLKAWEEYLHSGRD